MLFLFSNFIIILSFNPRYFCSRGDSSQLASQCSRETFSTHDFPSYYPNVVANQAVCSASEVAAFSDGKYNCAGNCRYRPGVQDKSYSTDILLCDTTKDTVDSITQGGKVGTSWNILQNFCDCPCESLVEVQEPSIVAMSGIFLAQSLALCIVGINMAFTEANLKVWRGAFAAFTTKHQSSKQKGSSNHSNAAQESEVGAANYD